MPNVKTDTEIREAVLGSKTASEALFLLHRSPAGEGYRWLLNKVLELKLDTSHWLRPESQPRNKRTLEEILTERSRYRSNHTLKRRLIAEGLLKNECSICGISTWRGNPLVLRLDHKNGVRDDYRFENLRLLCPNCDSQTDTYCGRNRRAGAVPIRCCLDCGKPSGRNLRCGVCYRKKRAEGGRQQTKIAWPEGSCLLNLLKDHRGNVSSLARALGVSDNAVRKRLRRHSSTGRTGDFRSLRCGGSNPSGGAN